MHSAKQSMKSLLLTFIGLLVFSLSTVGQTTENFDIITFKSPKGWQKEISESSVQIGIDGSKGTCVITMIKSAAGTSDPKENFKLAWESFVKEIVDPKSAPQMQPSVSKFGWISESGFSLYESDGKQGVVLLITSSGNGKMFNILILANTDGYQQEIDLFLDSVTFPKVTASISTPVVQTNISGLITERVWKSTQNRKDAMGGYAGYSSNTYQFLSNGTYKFSNVSFQTYAPKFQLVDEEGTFKLTGNKLTLSPTKSRYTVHQREKTDPPTKSGNLSLENVQYSFEFTTIYDRQRLILAPDSGSETKRDGAFNFYANGQMTRSYLYDAQ